MFYSKQNCLYSLTGPSLQPQEGEMPAVPFHTVPRPRLQWASMGVLLRPCFPCTDSLTSVRFAGRRLGWLMPRVTPIRNVILVPRLVASHLAEKRRGTLNSGLELHLGPAPDSEFSSGTWGPPLCDEEMTPPSPHYPKGRGFSKVSHTCPYC